MVIKTDEDEPRKDIMRQESQNSLRMSLGNIINSHMMTMMKVKSGLLDGIAQVYVWEFGGNGADDIPGMKSTSWHQQDGVDVLW